MRHTIPLTRHLGSLLLLSQFGFRHLLRWLTTHTGRIEFVILRTEFSSTVALHPIFGLLNVRLVSQDERGLR